MLGAAVASAFLPQAPEQVEMVAPRKRHPTSLSENRSGEERASLSLLVGCIYWAPTMN